MKISICRKEVTIYTFYALAPLIYWKTEKQF